MNYFQGLFQTYYILFVVTFCLIIFLYRNSYINKKIETYAKLIVILCLVVAILDYSDSYITQLTLEYDSPLTVLRLIIAVMCYNLRPLVCLSVILLVSRNKSRREMILLFVPILINFVIFLIPLFRNNVIVFTIDKSNHFVRGPLGYTAHIVALIYLLYLVVESFRFLYLSKKREGLMILLCAVIIITSVILETFTEIQHVLWPSVSVTVTFYYIFIYAQISKRDQLTHLYNRKSYYEDLERYKNDITAIIVIDMNGLKYVNDNFGHTAGDEALITLSTIFTKSIIRKKMNVYRKGGDEFGILTFNCNEAQVAIAIDKIKENVNRTSYSVAIGYKMISGGISLELAEIQADKFMYADKENYYSSHKELKLNKHIYNAATAIDEKENVEGN